MSAALPTPLPLPTGYPHEGRVDAAMVGMDGEALRAVRDAFFRQQARGMFPGGQLVVRRHGRVVLDEAVGLARGFRDGEEPLAAGPGTPFPCFSAGKAIVSVLVGMAEDQGLLDVRAPVASVWPGFARNGKASITILDVLTHRGGILVEALANDPGRWADWGAVVEALEAAPPSHRRGGLRYHPLEYGWILAEVVQRATGRDFRALLAEDLAGPAGLSGLRFGASADEIPTIARAYYLGGRPVRIASFTVSRDIEAMMLDPRVTGALVPGAGLVTDAGTLAGFYELLVRGGLTADGRRILKSDTIDRCTRPVLTGYDRTNAAPITLGRGFFVGGRLPSLYGWWDSRGVFGHAGMFCTLGFADANTGVAAAIVTNGNRSKADLVRRMLPLVAGIRGACR